MKLNPLQREYIEEKMENVARHLGRFSETEATEYKVVITQEDTKAEEDRFLCEVMILLPKKTSLNCTVRAVTPAAAIDLCVDKLKKQMEKFRTKVIG